MTLSLETITKNAAVNAVAPRLNGGSIKIYGGTRPATANTAIASQTLLVSLAFSSTAFGSASGGVATANPITSGIAAATGTATWARLYLSDGVTVWGDVDVGDPHGGGAGGGAELQLPTVAISQYITVTCSSFTLDSP